MSIENGEQEKKSNESLSAFNPAEEKFGVAVVNFLCEKNENDPSVKPLTDLQRSGIELVAQLFCSPNNLSHESQKYLAASLDGLCSHLASQENSQAVDESEKRRKVFNEKMAGKKQRVGSEKVKTIFEMVCCYMLGNDRL